MRPAEPSSLRTSCCFTRLYTRTWFWLATKNSGCVGQRMTSATMPQSGTREGHEGDHVPRHDCQNEVSTGG